MSWPKKHLKLFDWNLNLKVCEEPLARTRERFDCAAGKLNASAGEFSAKDWWAGKSVPIQDIHYSLPYWIKFVLWSKAVYFRIDQFLWKAWVVVSLITKGSNLKHLVPNLHWRIPCNILKAHELISFVPPHFHYQHFKFQVKMWKSRGFTCVADPAWDICGRDTANGKCWRTVLLGTSFCQAGKRRS